MSHSHGAMPESAAPQPAAGGHSHGTGGGDPSSAIMAMVFQNFIQTPLFTTTWTPKTGGTYAATCIFLVLLAMIGRGLIAVKAALDQRWLNQARQRRFVVVAGQSPQAERAYSDPDAKIMTLLSENGVEEKVKVVTRTAGPPVMPWRFSVDLPRAAFVTLMAGVGYLM
ncbi:hypothetical protein LOZ12_004229 [Ophidiomyces ophidiicola]|uniref:Uncharacterized protein n=1 Tax=Ophidiomyces ophidiicola TaxID=1387563 RepID=A0ACB8V0K2_9EURO|nr:uncharacterized protein LOZ57_000532 [Ophidiomyces ophidiicola]KAI1910096.1 hypothetical protein LOZ61_004614 [Ophidiomyces ophidiicola]KAI1919232.1 hypothetical protein LOZ64_002352 [Ophidiomyces ophidiicola]KAI1927197.1 hypothetical protein LOZ60_003249 [Ophidiomyces ophidiicola]KAI1944382.1 hypothetical protein LOZ62_004181 [Ophidiomyces ophidiicola]KAI1954182.1 hypothetical protein LOZ57_000532 [Ophidiomyces ophidiicola]